MRSSQETLNVPQISTESLPAKLVQACSSFYMLASLERMGPKGQSMMIESDKTGITRNTFHVAMEHIFNNRKNLDPEELEQMAEHAFRKLSKNKERITLSDFCTAVGSNDAFDGDAMVQTFDVDRRRGFLEMLFDDGASKPKKLKGTEMIYEYKYGGLLRRVKEEVVIEGQRRINVGVSGKVERQSSTVAKVQHQGEVWDDTGDSATIFVDKNTGEYNGIKNRELD